MSDLFQAIPPQARQENLAAYRQFLRDRDGFLDMQKRTLSLREEGMVRYSQPPAKTREIDRELFAAQYLKFDRATPTPLEMLLLLALVKVNAAEAYGVETTFAKTLYEALVREDALELTLLIEELYHTRILLSSALLYGVTVTAPYKPPAMFRAVIFGIGHGPEAISRPLVLAGEILGTCSS